MKEPDIDPIEVGGSASSARMLWAAALKAIQGIEVVPEGVRNRESGQLIG